MKVIAFDLGKNFAHARNCTGGTIVTGLFISEGDRAHRQGQLMAYLTNLFEDLMRADPLDIVVYETPFARGRDATRSLWGIAGIIEACASNAGLPVIDVAVPTIKKFATGHGKACKEEMIVAAQKFGYRGGNEYGINEHEADAVCLLRYAEANLERA